jgi:hypothetical protein
MEKKFQTTNHGLCWVSRNPYCPTASGSFTPLIGVDIFFCLKIGEIPNGAFDVEKTIITVISGFTVNPFQVLELCFMLLNNN